MNVPSSLLQYLSPLLSPPGHLATVAYTVGDLARFPDESLQAVILVHPCREMVDQANRILLPHGNLAIVPEGEEVDTTCYAEDTGFEIRDALSVVTDIGDVCYTSKPGRAEKEAGCHNLTPMKGAEAVSRKEGSAGMANPRAGAGRTADTVKNFHPTVKPVAAMKWCLGIVGSSEGVILEPFCGSGTTLVACVESHYHNAIGIEMDPAYVQIADARVKHAVRSLIGDAVPRVLVDDVRGLVEVRDVEDKAESDDIFGLLGGG